MDNISNSFTLQQKKIVVSNYAHYCFVISPQTQNSFIEQMQAIIEGITYLYSQYNFTKTNARFARIFLSDIQNQYDYIVQSELFDLFLYAQSTSIIQQIPCNNSKITLLLTCTDYSNSIIHTNNDSIGFVENEYTFWWTTNRMYTTENSVQKQTIEILNSYQKELKTIDCSIQESCVRTWFFIRDIDTRYAAMVQARKEMFQNIDLTPETHFITSTGIEGAQYSPQSLVSFDALAIQGLHLSQIQYLLAPTHLNPTHEYGVTFERGVAISLSDYNLILISGTASINNKGEIVAVGDMKAQLDRTFENIKALFLECNTKISDILYSIVYIRDIQDTTLIHDYMKKKYSDMVYVLVQAPVCRPGWLVEIECVAYSVK